MSTPEFRFPDLDMRAGKLNSPKPEQLAPPVSIRDIERDARVIQLNSKLQLYRVGLASAAMGVLVALGVIGAWRLLVPSPVAHSVASARPANPQRVAAPPVPPAKRIASAPAASMPAIGDLPGLPMMPVASAPAGSVFAPPIRVAVPGSAPLANEVSTPSAGSGKPGIREAINPVRLPPPVARASVEQVRRPAAEVARPSEAKAADVAQSHKQVVERKQADAGAKHVELRDPAKKVATKTDNKKRVEQSSRDTTGNTSQARGPHATASHESPQAAILYVAPNRAESAPLSQRQGISAAPHSAVSRPAAPVPAQAPGPSPMDIAGVPTAGVILVESSTPDGRLVRPYRVGQTLPSGEVLVSADPSDGRIVTNRRTINLKH